MAIQFTERFVPPVATTVRWDEVVGYSTPDEVMAMLRVLIEGALQNRRKYWYAMTEDKAREWSEDFADLINREEIALNQKKNEETTL